MELSLQFGIATGNLGNDFLRFLILFPIAIAIDLAIKAIRKRSKKTDDEMDSRHTGKKSKKDKSEVQNKTSVDKGFDHNEVGEDDDGLDTE